MLEMGTIFHIAKISLVWAASYTLNNVNATAAILHVFYKDLTVYAIGQTKPIEAPFIMWAPSLILFRMNHVNERRLHPPYLWPKRAKNICHIFQTKKAQQRKLLMKIWMMSMIQQKKMPSKLKENSSLDGLKATHGWIMIKKTTAWSAVNMSMFG